MITELFFDKFNTLDDNRLVKKGPDKKLRIAPFHSMFQF